MVISSKVLLVEGADDARVIGSILERKRIPENFSIRDNGGIDKLLISIPVYIKSSGITTLGTVIDADFDIDASWARLRHILQDAGYGNLPEKPARDGTILMTEGLPNFGIWIMPNNELSGMLEDFVAMLIKPGDELRTHAIDIVHRLPECDGRFKDAHIAKAVIHTWLAWQENPGTPMGSAITFKYLDSDTDAALEFVSWLEKLFNR